MSAKGLACALIALLAAACDDDTGARDLAIADLATPDLAVGDLAPPRNLRLSGGDGGVAEAEPAVAASGAVIAAAWMALEDRQRIETARSDDRGASFRSTGPLALAGNEQGSDPSVVVDGTGVVHVGYLSNGATFDVWHVAWTGAGFTPRVRVSDVTMRARDNPWMALAPDGALLFVYSEEKQPGGPNQLVVARSTDGGASFSRVAVAIANAQVQAAVVDGAGRLHVAYVGPDPDREVHYLRFLDGGLTPGTPTPSLAQAYNLARPSVAVDGATALVAYLRQTPLRVELARMTDGVASSTTIVASGAPTVAALLNPVVASFAPGRVAVGYYTGSFTPGRWRIARSDDGGGSFGVARAISDVDLAFTDQRGWPSWLGDYASLAVADGRLFTAFTDNRLGPSHIYFAEALP